MPRTKMPRKKSSVAKRSMQQSTARPSAAGPSAKNPLEHCCSELKTLLTQQYNSKTDYAEAVNAFFDVKAAKLQEDHKRLAGVVTSMVQQSFNEMPQHLHESLFHPNQGVKKEQAKLSQNKKESKKKIDQKRKKEERQGESSSESDEDMLSVTHHEEIDTNEKAKSARRSRSVETEKFKRPQTPPGPKRQPRNRSKSTTATPRDTYKTPLSFRRLVAGSTITPKVFSDTPITMMRRPMTGEMAVSVTGSPLMVSAVASEEVPTVNVPLMDGRVFSIMPEVGGEPFDLPQLDEVTLQQLRRLRENLRILAPDSPE